MALLEDFFIDKIIDNRHNRESRAPQVTSERTWSFLSKTETTPVNDTGIIRYRSIKISHFESMLQIESTRQAHRDVDQFLILPIQGSN